MLNGLDLFSGGGGLAEGLHRWVRPVAYCEVERGAQRVLLSRMARGELYAAPIWDDVRTLRGSLLPEVDIIAGGFPCQDLSVAGAGAGLDGGRSGLVFEFLRLIGECRPRFAFMENVPALAVRGLDRVLLGLNALGYDARWTIVSAAEVGAPHLRERIWIAANSNSNGRWIQSVTRTQCQGSTEPIDDGAKESLANAERMRRGQPSRGVDTERRSLSTQEREKSAFKSGSGSETLADPEGFRGFRGFRGFQGRLPSGSEAEHARAGINGQHRQRISWEVEPDVGRVADGVADRVNRLRVLGNGVVPECVEEAFMRLAGIEKRTSL